MKRLLILTLSLILLSTSCSSIDRLNEPLYVSQLDATSIHSNSINSTQGDFTNINTVNLSVSGNATINQIGTSTVNGTGYFHIIYVDMIESNGANVTGNVSGVFGAAPITSTGGAYPTIGINVTALSDTHTHSAANITGGLAGQLIKWVSGAAQWYSVTQADVISWLGFTPLQTITSQNVTDALGYVPGTSNFSAFNSFLTGTTTIQTANITTLNAPTGRGATIFIAASNATALEKAQADYVCAGTGANDTATIQNAWNSLASQGGIVKLSTGTFNINQLIWPGGGSNSGLQFIGSGVSFGPAYGGTTLSSSSNLSSMISFQNGGGFGLVSGMTIWGSGTMKSGYLVDMYSTTTSISDFTLRDVYINSGGNGYIDPIRVSANATNIWNIRFDNVWSENFGGSAAGQGSGILIDLSAAGTNTYGIHLNNFYSVGNKIGGIIKGFSNLGTWGGSVDITNSDFDVNVKYNLLLQAPKNVTVMSTQFGSGTTANGTAVRIDDVGSNGFQDCSFIGNHFYSQGVLNNMDYAFYYSGNHTTANMTVIGNTVVGAKVLATYGLPADTVVMGNQGISNVNVVANVTGTSPISVTAGSNPVVSLQTPLAGQYGGIGTNSTGTLNITTVNGTLAIMNGKTVSVIKSITFNGTGDNYIVTMPTTNFTAARTDAAQSFTGKQTFTGAIDLNGTQVQQVAYIQGSSSTGLQFYPISNTANPGLSFFTGTGSAWVERLRISGNAATAVATWTSITQVGVKQGGVENLMNYTVATLPAGTRGDIAYVTDALAPTFLGVIVGGGAVVTPVFYNGANWVGY